MATPASAYRSSKYQDETSSSATNNLHRSATFSNFSNSEKSKQLSHTTKAESSDDGETGNDFIHSPPSNNVPANNKETRQNSDLVHDEEYSTIVWSGPGNRIPLIIFPPDCVMRKDPFARVAGERYHLTFKIVRTECKLVRTILQTFGFHETHANSPDYNLMWTGSHLKPYVLRGMTEFQKVNHFPRSYEITRKDRMYKNIQRLQQIKGLKYFDFVPTTYVLPGEYQDFCTAFLKDKGPYIVKPVASSRGRGIFLCNQPDIVPLDENYVVTKYISNPYLIDGFKFDLRIYVAVTSFDPLIIYMYEEGLARFATVKYQMHMRTLRNQCMHLTNYSVNKRSNDFVQNDDADVEDFGNKWSLGALLRYLQSEGVDTAALILRIEDVVVKALISVEMTVGTACKMFQPFRGNCYELFGFDIILDEHLRPWLLEVNLSPSLACDSPLDFKVKNNMLCDLFSLVGVVCYDPILKTSANHKQSRKSAVSGGDDIMNRYKSQVKSKTSSVNFSPSRQRPNSASNSYSPAVNLANPAMPMGMDEARMVRWFKEEYHRRGGWIRLHPAKHTWEQYSAFLQSTSNNNILLHQKLFPEMWPPGSSSNGTVATHKGKMPLHSLSSSALSLSLDPGNDHYGRINGAYEVAQEHLRYFSRKLGHKPHSARDSKRKRNPSPTFQNNRDPEELIPKHVSLSSSHLSQTGGDSDTLIRSSNPVNNIFRGNLVKPVLVQESREINDVKQNLLSPHETVHFNSVGDKEALLADNLSEANNSSVCNTEPEDLEGNSETPMCSASVVSAKPTDSQVTYKPQRISFQSLIACGGDMNRFQARTAFSAYLNRVQKRFIVESRLTPEEDSDETKASEEQMDLVLRFLRHASSHLTQSLKVAAPSKRLSLPQRKRILAQTLSLFVRHYDKETDSLRQKVGNENQKGMDFEAFKKVIHEGTENDLELFLTIYTQKHKSAGIFIDSNVTSAAKATIYPPETPKLHRENTNTADNIIRPLPNNQIMSSTADHLRQIALIYGKSVNETPFIKRRPLSANLPYRQSSMNLYEVNPSINKTSASSKLISGTLKSKPHVETFDEDAINLALQRMALKQQARQYMADKIPSGLNLKNFKVRPHSAERRLDYMDSDSRCDSLFLYRGSDASNSENGSFSSHNFNKISHYQENLSNVRKKDDGLKNRSVVNAQQSLDVYRSSKQLLDPSINRITQGSSVSQLDSGVINPRPPQGPKPPSLSKKISGSSHLSRSINVSSANISSLNTLSSSRRNNSQQDPFWT